MFKLNKYKSERIGERVEFRLSSFQASQVPKGWDKLILSLISADTGKTITKTNKAMVRSGTCQWTETFLESIWIHDDDSKEIENSILKLVVSMGSQKTGILGEVAINLTDYVRSRNSGTFLLPLKKCDWGTIFQIRVECLNPPTLFSDGRKSKDANYPHSPHSDDGDSKSDGSDDTLNRIFEPSSNNILSVTNPNEAVNRDMSFSASGSHCSSDSGESAIPRSNFSPRNNLNGGSCMGRQDSAGSHVSSNSSAGHADDFSRSNPSSGSATPNRWQDPAALTSRGLGPVSPKPTCSSKDILEASEETIEEPQDEAKMWERHAQKLKRDIEKFKKESADKLNRQVELDMELAAAYSERDSLKKELEQLKTSLKEVTAKQTFTRAAKNEVMLRVQKELQDEVKFLKESNANLNLQLKKTQEANVELVSILEELEETIEKQKVEMASLLQQSPLCEPGGEMWRQKLLDAETEWAAELSSKEEEIRKLQETLSGTNRACNPIEKDSSCDSLEFSEEMEVLRNRAQELEKDCAELTDENLKLIFKLKKSGKDIQAEKDSDLTEPSSVQMKNLEKKCGDLEIELQYSKHQACDLDIKLRESQLEIEAKILELEQLKQKLESLQCVDMGASGTVTGARHREPREDVQHKMMLLASRADSHASSNDMLERKSMELESCKRQISGGEDENVQVSETQLQPRALDSGKKVQGLVELLNAPKQSEEMFMSDPQHMQIQADTAKYSEGKFERDASELELKLKESDYENQQIMEETSILKVQLQKMAHLQDEILVLKRSLEDAKFDKGKFEVLLHSVFEEGELLKAEMKSLMEKVSNMQKALEDGGNERSNNVALEEKLLNMEGELGAKEASFVHEDELKYVIDQIRRSNIEHQRKIKRLEEENYKLMRKLHAFENDIQDGTERPSIVHDEEADVVQVKRVDDSKLDNLEAKIHLLENDLAESIEANTMYKIQLQELIAERQISNSDVRAGESGNDTRVQPDSRVASLEAELKEMEERYLNMSLQYAEVEAEREELVMKLKSTTKKGWFA